MGDASRLKSGAQHDTETLSIIHVKLKDFPAIWKLPTYLYFYRELSYPSERYNVEGGFLP